MITLTTKTTRETMMDLKAAMAQGPEAKLAAARTALWYVVGSREVIAQGEHLHLAIERLHERQALESLQEMVRLLDASGIPTAAVLPPVATTEGTWRAVIVL